MSGWHEAQKELFITACSCAREPNAAAFPTSRDASAAPWATSKGSAFSTLPTDSVRQAATIRVAERDAAKARRARAGAFIGSGAGARASRQGSARVRVGSHRPVVLRGDRLRPRRSARLLEQVQEPV